MICERCKVDKQFLLKGVCFACVGKPVTAIVLPSMPEPHLEILAEIVEAKLEQAHQPHPPTNGVRPTAWMQVCDGCDKEFKSLEKFGKLNLCVACKTREHNASVELQAYDPKNYKTWPRCNSCHAHVVKEQLNEQDGLCFKCAQSKRPKVDSLAIKPTDSNKYQEFFNQEATAITDMLKERGPDEGLLELRQWIIDTTEALFSQEAQAFQTKSRLQSQKVKFNDLLSNLSAEEQAKLRIEDANYKPKSGEPRKLKSPLAQADKVKKLKKSMEEQVNAMFGGGLTPAEIAEKMKALGL